MEREWINIGWFGQCFLTVMCTRTTVNRWISVNITNMGDQNDKTPVEKVSVGVDEVHDVKGVKVEPTPAASSLPASEQKSHSTGENINEGAYINGKTVRYMSHRSKILLRVQFEMLYVENLIV